jgi:lipopolysaccharide transport system ATP-binding protein
VGRNGAGKSTLLKILSRITPPTCGSVQLRGRVGSLLEVGTGFHPELTGRENIYLSGAILGMRRSEIVAKFDEIVAFAEIERFIETPVKHYSSGMYLRLAFAVAAHLDPEILIVDEVLAVGDARFQKKCLNRMQAVGEQGRTVLFVSHNMPAVTRLCPRAILLENASIAADGPAYDVVSSYLSSGTGMTGMRQWDPPSGDRVAKMHAFYVHGEDGTASDAFDIRNPVLVSLDWEVCEPGHVLTPNFQFFDDENALLFQVIDHDSQWRRRPRPTGRYRSTVIVPGNLLSEGTLSVGASVIKESPFVIHAEEEPCIVFQILDTVEGDSARGDYGGRMKGMIRPLLNWKTEFEPAPDSDVQLEGAISEGNI